MSDSTAEPAAPAAASSSSTEHAPAPPPPPPAEPEAALAAMLAKMAAYVEGEAEVSIEDYRLLKAMNDAAADKYSHMAEYSEGLVELAAKLQKKCELMMPQLAQIDDLEAQVGELEGAVAQLDAYTKRLEAKFMALRPNIKAQPPPLL